MGQLRGASSSRRGTVETRTLKGTALWIAVGLVVAAMAATCSRGDTGNTLQEARIAYGRRDLPKAEQLFNQVLEEEPDNAFALIGLTEIYLDRGQLDRADETLDRLGTMELDVQGERLYNAALERYLGFVYDNSRGDGPLNPADPAAYEEALIGLFNLADDTEPYNDDLVQLFLYEARGALGMVDPTEPPGPAYILDASLEQLEAARDAYSRFVEHDDRLTRVLDVPDAIRTEATDMLTAIEFAVFRREFRERFNEQLRPALVEAERWLPDRDMIRIVAELNPTTPAPDADDEPEARAAWENDVELYVVVRDLTELAYQAKGLERGNDMRQLGSSLEELQENYAGIERVSFEVNRDGVVTLEVLVPYHILLNTAYQLERYLAWRAEHPREPEGTGQPSDGTGGTGEGATPPPEVPED